MDFLSGCFPQRSRSNESGIFKVYDRVVWDYELIITTSSVP